MPGFFIGKFPEPGKSWKMTLVLESPASTDADGSFWLQIDMFLQTKIAMIVATGTFSGLQVCQKCFHGQGSSPDPTGELTALPQIP